jgi:hypothetical protein
MSSNLSYTQQAMLYSYKRVTITAVDTQTAIVDAVDDGAQTYKIPMGYWNPAYTAVPAVDEVWLIKKTANGWELYARYEDSSFKVSLSEMDAGDHRIEVPGKLYINADAVVFSSGALNNIVDGSAISFPLDFYQDSGGLNQDVLIIQGSALDYPLFSITEKVNEGYWSLSFGDGSTEQDVSIYRSGPNTLTIDGNLVVTGNYSNTSASQPKYVLGTYTPSRVVDTSGTIQSVANVLATLISDLGYV